MVEGLERGEPAFFVCINRCRRYVRGTLPLKNLHATINCHQMTEGAWLVLIEVELIISGSGGKPVDCCSSVSSFKELFHHLFVFINGLSVTVRGMFFSGYLC